MTEREAKGKKYSTNPSPSHQPSRHHTMDYAAMHAVYAGYGTIDEYVSAYSAVTPGVTGEQLRAFKAYHLSAWNSYLEYNKTQIRNPFLEKKEAPESGPSLVAQKKKVVYDPFTALKNKNASTVTTVTLASHEANVTVSVDNNSPSLLSEVALQAESHNQNVEVAHMNDAVQVVASDGNALCEGRDGIVKDPSANKHSTPPPDNFTTDITTATSDAIISPPATEIAQQQAQRNTLKLVLKPTTESRLKIPAALSADEEAIAAFDARIEAEEKALEAFLGEQARAMERIQRAIENRQKQCEMRVQTLKLAREEERERREVARKLEEERLKKEMEKEGARLKLQKEQEEEVLKAEQKLPEPGPVPIVAARAGTEDLLDNAAHNQLDDMDSPPRKSVSPKRSIGGRDAPTHLFLPNEEDLRQAQVLQEQKMREEEFIEASLYRDSFRSRGRGRGRGRGGAGRYRSRSRSRSYSQSRSRSRSREDGRAVRRRVSPGPPEYDLRRGPAYPGRGYNHRAPTRDSHHGPRHNENFRGRSDSFQDRRAEYHRSFSREVSPPLAQREYVHPFAPRDNNVPPSREHLDPPVHRAPPPPPPPPALVLTQLPVRFVPPPPPPPPPAMSQSPSRKLPEEAYSPKLEESYDSSDSSDEEDALARNSSLGGLPPNGRVAPSYVHVDSTDERRKHRRRHERSGEDERDEKKKRRRRETDEERGRRSKHRSHRRHRSEKDKDGDSRDDRSRRSSHKSSRQRSDNREHDQVAEAQSVKN
ncbi:hypothetical protein BC830DRAFT_1116933 [Chytriomyces sp. MP71]|nr:hypothetical protein BC830DRAFT_1116933 [Chytriomyces sp. MP71]